MEKVNTYLYGACKIALMRLREEEYKWPHGIKDLTTAKIIELLEEAIAEAEKGLK